MSGRWCCWTGKWLLSNCCHWVNFSILGFSSWKPIRFLLDHPRGFKNQSLNWWLPSDIYGHSQYKPIQTSILVILSAMAAPMTIQYIELTQRTYLQGHFNFPFPLQTLLKAHQLKLGDFFFYFIGKHTKEFCVYRPGAMATATGDHVTPKGRAGTAEG